MWSNFTLDFLSIVYCALQRSTTDKRDLLIVSSQVMALIPMAVRDTDAFRL